MLITSTGVNEFVLSFQAVALQVARSAAWGVMHLTLSVAKPPFALYPAERSEAVLSDFCEIS